MPLHHHLTIASLPQRQPDMAPKPPPGKPRLAAVPPSTEPVRAPLIARSVITGVAALGESLVILALGTLLMIVYVRPDDGVTFLTYVGMLTLGTLGLLLLFFIRRLYTVEALLQPGRAVGALSAAFMAIFAASAGLMFLTKAGTQFSRVWLGSWRFINFRRQAGLMFLTKAGTQFSRVWLAHGC